VKGATLSQPTDGFNPFDPTGMMKSMRDASMDSWSKMMIQLVNTDAYAKATGTFLDAWMTSSMPFRKALETVMTQVLTNFQLPIRTDVTSLAERLTHIEMRLDDLEAKLEEGLRAGRKASARPKSDSGSGEPKS
jgi:hypothetical protein